MVFCLVKWNPTNPTELNKTPVYRRPWWLSGKESAYQCRRRRLDPWVGKIPWRRAWQPTPVFLPGESWTEEPGGLQSVGLQRVGHHLATKQQHKRMDPECARATSSLPPLVWHCSRQRQPGSVDEGPQTRSHAMTQKRRPPAHAHPRPGAQQQGPVRMTSG